MSYIRKLHVFSYDILGKIFSYSRCPLLTEIITRMKKLSMLFNKIYQRIYYGGSYYDGLKINNPEEYDLDIILDLPKILGIKLEDSQKLGYVYVSAGEYEKFKKSSEEVKYPKLESLLCDGKYLSTKKVRSWLESLLSKVLNEYRDQNETTITMNEETWNIDIINFKKSGPAFTLMVKTNINGKESVMNIDLVPCFLVTADKWPQGYVANPAVEKKPHSNEEEEKYWRLSFQEQEKALIRGKHFKTLKPSVKLIKQLRNYQNHKSIFSYSIKTIFLWELKNQKEELWTKAPLSFVFMTMLKRYAEYLKKGEIRYYWNPKYNLLAHVNKATLEDFGNKIYNMVKRIEQNPVDPFIVAKYLLSSANVEELIKEVDIGKRHLKKQMIVALQKSKL